MEAAFLRKLTEDASVPDAAIAAAFLEKPAELIRVQRYVTSANSAFYKALSQLEKLQKARAAAAYEAAMFESLSPSAGEPAGIGFVSQKPSQQPESVLQPSVTSNPLHTQQYSSGQSVQHV